ncbi:MAG: YggS family pyridoxal phosphate-dependent enzyme [Phycisphaerae bacterium]
MSAVRTRISRNLEQIRRQIAEACRRAGRDQRGVGIVAITKSADLEAIKAAVEIGLTDLGESRVQQLVERAGEVTDWLHRRSKSVESRIANHEGQADRATAADSQLTTPNSELVRWHMVGHLQRNKVRQVLDVSRMIHSVDSLRLAEEIGEAAEKAGSTVDIMLQVNCSQEPQKFGCAVGAAPHLAELIATMRNIRLVGLMTMAPLVKDPQQARPAFALLREMFEELRHDHVGGEAFKHLSMGMSNDYPIAVEEGATVLRIGTALFQ